MAKAKETRALFRDEEGQIVTSIFVERTAAGILLLHDYPPADFAPLPGWTVKGRGFHLKIASVDGRALLCNPVEG